MKLHGDSLLNERELFALQYVRALKWAVVPIHTIVDGKCSCKNAECRSPGKHPRTSRGVKDASTDPLLIAQWWEVWPDANIGIATGKISNIVAVDVDPRNGGTETLEKLQNENKPFDDSVHAQTGGGGLHLIYKYPSEPLANKKIKGGIDIKSDGGYILVAPSNHISGHDYSWELSSDPFENEIPPFPEWFKEILSKRESCREEDEELPSEKIPQEKYQEIRSALTAIPCEDRDIWKDVGMALHSTRAGNQAYGLWAEWSQQSSKYDPSDTRKIWDSFTSSKGITLSTLFDMAYKNGWIEPVSLSISTPVDAPPFPPRKEEKKIILPIDLLEPTGVIKEIYDYMMKTCRKIQPIYFLNAAISLAATVMGQKYETETGLRTNIYLISIGPTASGKEHGRKCIKDILSASELSKYLGGEEIRSGQGLLAAMERCSNSVFQLDEFGLFLQSVQNPSSGAHKAEVMVILMKLFSSANTIFMGSEYADQKHKPRVELQYPSCNLHATTTGREFYAALQSVHVVNGYLNRMLILESEDRNPPKQMPRRRPVPYSVLEWIKAISNGDGYEKEGNLTGLNPATPITISNSPEAMELIEAFEERIERLTEKEDPNQLDALWGRALEHVWKLSTVVAGSNLHAEVTKEDMTYAIKFVEHSVSSLCVSVAQRVADSPFQAKVKECLLGIKGAGEKGLTERDLHRHRSFSRLQMRERKEVLEVLVQSGEIVKYKFGSEGGRKREAWVSLK